MIEQYLTGNWHYYVFLFFLAVNIFLMVPLLFWEKSNPRGTLLWILVLTFMAPVGFVLYLFIGPTFYHPSKEFKTKAMGDDSISSLHAEEMNKVRKKERAREIPKEEGGFIRTLGAAGVRSYSDTNHVELYTDGRMKFNALLSDIENAEKSVHLEYFIVANDRIGNRILDAAGRKALEGVEVRMLFDAYGFGKGFGRKIRELRKKGVKVAFFHSMLRLAVSPRKNNRNHRKLAVIDSRVCYVGGFNIGDEYLGTEDIGYWRDTAVRMRGDAVDWVQLRFLIDWRYASKEDLTKEMGYFDLSEGTGETGVQIVSGGPDVLRDNPIEMQYLLMFSRAKETLYMHTPFLAPNSAMVSNIKMAAAAGVDVRLIIPDKTAQPMTYWSNLYNANILMRSGVRVYFYKGGFVHSKAIVVDSRYCSVGSANLDERSMNLNFETNAMIYSEELGKQMTEEFLRDLERCEEYSVEEYLAKPFRHRCKVAVSRLATSLL